MSNRIIFIKPNPIHPLSKQISLLVVLSTLWDQCFISIGGNYWTNSSELCNDSGFTLLSNIVKKHIVFFSSTEHLVLSKIPTASSSLEKNVELL